MDDPAQDSAWPLVPPGIWLDVRGRVRKPPQPALFLDRDGVIVHDRGFIATPSDAALCPGAAALIRTANDTGVPVLVATNQSGIDRGLFGWEAFVAVEARIAELLAEEGAAIDAVAACPFHPDFTPGYGGAHARYRKPAPGLFFALADALDVALPKSWMVGDQPRDLAAARDAGLAGGILVGDPDGEAARAVADLATPTFTITSLRSLTEATAFLETTTLPNG